MRPLVLDENSIAGIKSMVDYADQHRFDIRAVFRIMADERLAPGNDPNFVCIVPVGFRCCFSFEEQPIGWCRHLSVSILPFSGLYPHHEAVSLLAIAFGFFGERKDWTMFLEEEVCAVNLVQKEKP